MCVASAQHSRKSSVTVSPAGSFVADLEAAKPCRTGEGQIGRSVSEKSPNQRVK